MFHKIKNVTAYPDYKILVQFSEGITKIYNVKQLIENNSMFKILRNEELFYSVQVDIGGYGIIWSDDIDISCDELFENGKIIETPFDGLMAFSDATLIGGLNESTLRKAISYGKLIDGIDVCKYGKQWVVSIDAMEREYGIPKNSSLKYDSENKKEKNVKFY
ncbi:MAG: DUF2442 domain-containing protein [Clostridium sp.]|nr:DUF2442 domain-containing protein [Clostridium sp.]